MLFPLELIRQPDGTANNQFLNLAYRFAPKIFNSAGQSLTPIWKTQIGTLKEIMRLVLDKSFPDIVIPHKVHPDKTSQAPQRVSVRGTEEKPSRTAFAQALRRRQKLKAERIRALTTTANQKQRSGASKTTTTQLVKPVAKKIVPNKKPSSANACSRLMHKHGRALAGAVAITAVTVAAVLANQP